METPFSFGSYPPPYPEQVQLLYDARKNYKGRFFRTTQMLFDAYNPNFQRKFLLTTSTLAGLNKPKLTDTMHPVIHSIECPGARISQLLDP